MKNILPSDLRTVLIIFPDPENKGHNERRGGNSSSIVCEAGVASDRGNYSTRSGAQEFDFYGYWAKVVRTVVVPLQEILP